MNKRTRDTVIIIVVGFSILLNLFIGGQYLWSRQKNEIRVQMAEQLLNTIIATVRSQGEISINLGTQSVVLIEKIQPVFNTDVMTVPGKVEDVNE